MQSISKLRAGIPLLSSNRITDISKKETLSQKSYFFADGTLFDNLGNGLSEIRVNVNILNRGGNSIVHSIISK